MTDLRPEFGSGPLDAGLWIIGRDYGAEEKARCAPFVGQAGGVLTHALKAAGVEREHVRIDNLVPLQPPGNNWEAHRPEDVAWGQARLLALLATHKPRVVVALGNEVGRFLLGKDWPESEGIQDVRGYLWDAPCGRVLTTIHPAGILRDWTPWRALLDVDLRRAVNEWREDCPPLDVHDVRIVATLDDVREAHESLKNNREPPLRARSPRGAPNTGDSSAERGRYARVRQEVCAPARNGRSHAGAGELSMQSLHADVGMDVQWLAIDIEHTEQRQLACVAFTAETTKAWVVPAVADWQLALIRELCESNVPKVLQNGQYDRFFLRRFAGITLRNQVFDTMLAWHALQPELAGKKMQTRKRAFGRRTVKSLKFLASIYERVPWWKDYAFQGEDERYTLCGRDACVTLSIARKQAKQLTP